METLSSEEHHADSKRSFVARIMPFVIVAWCIIVCAAVPTGLYLITKPHQPLPPCMGICANPERVRVPLINPTGTLPTLDPARAQPTDPSEAEPLTLIYPTLLTFDDHQGVISWAASLPTVSADGLTYTFRIRASLKWSDGTALDATTFAYSLNRTLNPCSASPSASLFAALKDAAAFSHEQCTADGKSVHGSVKTLIGDALRTPDPLTLVMVLTRPDAALLSALTTIGAAAQPSQLIDQYGNQQWTSHLDDNVGFGGNMFMLREWDQTNKYLILERNPWSSFTTPKLREIGFAIYPTLDAAYTAYQGNHQDIGVFPTSAYQQAQKRSDYHQFPLLTTDYLAVNWQQKPFDDVLARQAFALALDKIALAQQLGGSVSNDLSSGMLLPTDHLVPQGDPGYNSNLPAVPTGNAAQAQQDINAYAAKACKGRIASCPAVTVVTNDDLAAKQFGQALVSQWQATLPSYPIATQAATGCTTLMCSAKRVPHAALYLTTRTVAYPGPQQWLSSEFETNGPDNPGLFSIPAIDTLLRQADTTADSSNRAALYNQAEELLLTDVAAIPLFQHTQAYLIPSYMRNYNVSPLGYPTFEGWQQVYITFH